MRVVAVAAVLALVASGIAIGAPGGGGPEPPPDGPHVTDPEGDAYLDNAHMVAAKAAEACLTATPVTDFACAQLPVNPWTHMAGLSGVGAVPAPPALDVVAGWFEETPEALLVTLQVAALDESFEGIAPQEGPDGHWWGFLMLNWVGGDGFDCSEWVAFTADEQGFGGGYFRVEEMCTVEDPDEHPWGGACNAWWWCSAPVDVQVGFGRPGSVTWTVPREMLRDGEQGSELLRPNIISGRAQQVESVRVMGEAQALPILFWGNAFFKPTPNLYFVDTSEPGRAFTFETQRSASVQEPASPHHVFPGQVEDPRLDLHSMDIIETPGTLGVELVLSQVDEDPDGTWFWGAIGLADGHVIELSTSWLHSDDDRKRTGHASYWAPFTGPFGSYSIVVPVQLEEELGSPGTIRMILDRGQLPPIDAGDKTPILVGGMFSEEHYHRVVTPREVRDIAHFRIRADGFTDAPPGPYAGMVPYTFQYDTPTGLLDGVVRIPDARGDTVPPDPLFDHRLQSRFDITYIEAQAVDEELVHLTVRIHDLSQATVPRLYDGMFYAFGVEVGSEATMVGPVHPCGAWSRRPGGSRPGVQAASVVDRHDAPWAAGTRKTRATIRLVATSSRRARSVGTSKNGRVIGVVVPSEWTRSPVTCVTRRRRWRAGVERARWVALIAIA